MNFQLMVKCTTKRRIWSDTDNDGQALHAARMPCHARHAGGVALHSRRSKSQDLHFIMLDFELLVSRGIIGVSRLLVVVELLATSDGMSTITVDWQN
jgi:hypothetical protein